ncbi:MAG: hypothetical protein ACKOCK_03140, partial [Chloroflexota bacterium]
MQAAVDAANDGYIVTIGPGTYTEEIEITGKSLVLLGCPDGGDVILTNASYRHYIVTATRDSVERHLAVYDLTLAGYSDPEAGEAGNGGGLHSEGAHLCVGMRTEIHHGSQLLGGGIWFVGAGSDDPSNRYVLTITDSASIHNNSATIGGGIYADSYTATNVTAYAEIYDNSALTHAGGVFVYYGSTGRFAGNAVVRNNNAGEAGGGIKLFGGGNLSDEDTIVFEDNAELRANTTNGKGGGLAVLYSEGKEAIVVRDHALIGDNRAVDGGGLYVEGSDRVDILDDAELHGNTATGQGGALYHRRRDGQSTPGAVTLADRAVVSVNTAVDGAGFYFHGKAQVSLSDEAA